MLRSRSAGGGHSRVIRAVHGDRNVYEDDDLGHRKQDREFIGYEYGHGDYDKNGVFASRAIHPYSGDGEVFSELSAERGSRHDGNLFGHGVGDSGVDRSKQRNLRDGGRAQQRDNQPSHGVRFADRDEYYPAPEAYYVKEPPSPLLPNRHKEYIHIQAEPRRCRPRDRRAQDEDLFRSAAKSPGDRPKGSSMNYHPAANFEDARGVVFRSRSRTSNSNRRYRGSEEDDRYNDYGRPYTYDRIYELRSNPFGAAYYGLWERGIDFRRRGHWGDSNYRSLRSC